MILYYAADNALGLRFNGGLDWQSGRLVVTNLHFQGESQPKDTQNNSLSFPDTCAAGKCGLSYTFSFFCSSNRLRDPIARLCEGN